MKPVELVHKILNQNANAIWVKHSVRIGSEFRRSWKWLRWGKTAILRWDEKNVTLSIFSSECFRKPYERFEKAIQCSIFLHWNEYFVDATTFSLRLSRWMWWKKSKKKNKKLSHAVRRRTYHTFSYRSDSCCITILDSNTINHTIDQLASSPIPYLPLLVLH